MTGKQMTSTLYDKLWQQHLVNTVDGQSGLLYVDRHLIHEVTSPQAFAGLAEKQRTVRCPQKTFATIDHNVSTQSNDLAAMSLTAQQQVTTLQKNCADYGIKLFDLNSIGQGIVHVTAPELGLTLPGMVIVCGDSHTSTHGAFGALAFGIGTSEVEHVLATQTLRQRKAKNMRIKVTGQLAPGITAKDLILYIAGKIGHSGATGHVIEFAGEAIQALSMEQRMTVCNMSIELGAKSGLIAPDNTTVSYLKNRPFAPDEALWSQALEDWQNLKSDDKAQFDCEYQFNVSDIAPQITWGTHPDQVVSVDQVIPDISDKKDQAQAQSAFDYMALNPGDEMTALEIDKVFIGSCTNSRLEDLRDAAKIVVGNKVNEKVTAIVVPGSRKVKEQAEVEGLHQVFLDAGFEWRLPGCSMCLAMNDDQLEPGERCASTSNRNFEGRQGKGGRTHLVSPIMAAAAAIHGKFVDVRTMMGSI